MSKLLLALLATVLIHPFVAGLWPHAERDQLRGAQFVAAATDAVAITGTWTASLESWNDSDIEDAVYLSLQRRKENGMMQSGSVYRRADLVGLDVDRSNKADVEVSFVLTREAGSFQFAGRFDELVGAGTFRFQPDSKYIDRMAGLGFGKLDEERVFSLAMHDVTTDFIKELRSLGYANLPLSSYESMRIHDASPSFLREMDALGFGWIESEKAIALRIHDVSPAFVREIRSAGFKDISEDQLLSFRIHDVTPGFIASFTGMGYVFQSADRLIELRIHDVDPEFVASIEDLGYELPGLHQLVSMRIHDVTAEYVRGLAELGHRAVPIEDLVSLSIHDVSLSYIRQIQSLGFKPTVSQLIEMKIHGMTPSDAKSHLDS